MRINQDRGPASGTVNISRIPDAVPKDEPKSKYGNPESYVVFGKRYYVMDDSKGFKDKGIASWYGEKFHGRRTSSGETYDMYAMTAAHKNLPLPTYVQVKNIKNGRTVIVKVNDRGPFHDNRIIDLSYSAAEKLDIVRSGTGLVEVSVINPRSYKKERTVTRSKSDIPGAPVYTGSYTAPIPTISSSVSNQIVYDKFYIQIGSFTDHSNAEKLRSRLESLKDKPVRISEASVNNRKLYRVRIGPIENIDIADAIVLKLGHFGITEHRIVVD